MERPRAVRLPGGRLHLQHGPIDIIASAEGPGQEAAFARATSRFQSVLTDLTAELPALRCDIAKAPRLHSQIAQAMLRATTPFAPTFLTPMAAVAGAVADEILSHLAGPDIVKAYANNGGDVAFHLAPGTEMTAAIAATIPAQTTIRHTSPVRGIATSGWQGRSHSLGIADSVTVLAQSAARADAAATLIANAVNLPDHPGITRRPARDLMPDSDLGDRMVTCRVPPLAPPDILTALRQGETLARTYRHTGLIAAAFLVLQGYTATIGADNLRLA